jgi:hypothetical protein
MTVVQAVQEGTNFCDFGDVSGLIFRETGKRGGYGLCRRCDCGAERIEGALPGHNKIVMGSASPKRTLLRVSVARSASAI